MLAASRSQYSMSARDVCDYFAASREWLRLRILHSDFPPPARFSEGRSAHRRWHMADIEAWEASRLHANDNTQFPVPAHDVQGQPEIATPSIHGDTGHSPGEIPTMSNVESRQVRRARQRNAKENPLGAFGFIDRKLTLGERFALAFTVKSIHGLPDFLQQYSDACDMLDMLEGKDCGRGGYILHKALNHFQSISGFRENELDQFEPRFKFMADACEKFIAEATAAGVAYVKAMEKRVDDESTDDTTGIPLSAIIRGPRTQPTA